MKLMRFSPAADPSPQMEGMVVEMLRVTMFRKQQLTVTMLDMSMACAISKSWKNASKYLLLFSTLRLGPQTQILGISMVPGYGGMSPLS